MAGSLAALKSLPCPAGKSCTAFHCLFRHDDDGRSTTQPDHSDNQVNAPRNTIDSPQHKDQTDLSANTPQVSQPKPHHTPPRPQVQGPPIKRFRTSEATSSPNPGSGIGSKHSLGSSVSTSPIKMPIPKSQPRSTDTALSKESGDSRRDTDTSTSSVSTNPEAIPKPAAKQAPKQPESLNPRHMAKAPAGHDLRFKLVKALHDEYARLNAQLKKHVEGEGMKLVMSAQELITKALDDEEDTAITKAAVYANSVKNKIMTYKRMSLKTWKDERVKAVMRSDLQQQSSSPSEPLSTGLAVPQEVNYLQLLKINSMKELERFGYISSAPSEDEIKATQEAVALSGNTEECDRCTRRFQVFPGRRQTDGALATNGKCTHHPGKKYNVDGDRRSAQKWRCCHRNTDDESAGCTTSDTHVFKTTDPKRLASVLNFAETPLNPDIPKGRAVCFDCEMGYTVYGLELIRITAVSWPDGDILLDILVKPFGETLDLNTRYSGVTPQAMLDAEPCKPGDDHRPTTDPVDPSAPPKLKMAPSPRAARDLFFSLVDRATPVIGHGLENDLNALRVLHPTCVDTVVLYPHRRGLPVRNGLKYLMSTHLGRHIQLDHPTGGEEEGAGVPQGHDSAEDARAAGELVRLKIRNDWKEKTLKGWTMGGDDNPEPPAFGASGTRG
ncbi:hypothetical protein F5Y15DRAFT_419881 [Xylariaceae sp. FL0016]|nr:hypothetical protein F5Y15DRAFT_419881 [Xylariaceae sp. FL0016]